MLASVEIRRAIAADIPDLVRLWHELAEYHASILPDLAPSAGAADLMTARLSDGLPSGKWVAFVALHAGATIGFLTLRPVGVSPLFDGRKSVHITDAGVTASHRGEGVATALWNAAETWCRAEGFEQVELGVVVGNDGAHRFWTKLGFTPQFSHLKRAL